MPDSITTDLSRMEAILRDSEIRYRRLFEAAKDGILILDATTGKLIDANPFMTTMLGYSHDEFLGKELWEIGLFRDMDANRAAVRELQETGYVRYAHLPLQSTNGDKVDVEFVSNVYEENLQQVIQCNIRDITQRMKIERELKASLAFIDYSFRMLVEGVTDYAIILLDPHGIITTWNAGAERLTLFKSDEIIGQHFSRFYLTEAVENDWPQHELTVARDEGRFEEEGLRVRKDGSRFWANVVITALRNEGGTVIGFSKITRDLTDRKKAEDQLQQQNELKASLRAKEVQVKDVHHRVKNNLQIISSLLSLQAGNTTDPVVVRLLRESQNRIQSMALIHESLYSSPDHTRIDFTTYVRELVVNLYRSYGATADHIRLDSDIEQTSLGLDYAIPCGLILNELIANCLKHAFPNGRQGEIFVRLRSTEAGEFLLSVGDNGVGLPLDVDLIRGRSLGLRLVRSLCEQLHGSFEVQTDSGTRFDIRFCGRNLPKDQTK